MIVTFRVQTYTDYFQRWRSKTGTQVLYKTHQYKTFSVGPENIAAFFIVFILLGSCALALLGNMISLTVIREKTDSAPTTRSPRDAILDEWLVTHGALSWSKYLHKSSTGNPTAVRQASSSSSSNIISKLHNN